MRIPTKPKVPKSFRGWELYDYHRAGRHPTVIYGHEDGYWAVIRPSNGPELIIYSESGEIESTAALEITKIAKLALKGTNGVGVDPEELVIEGGVSDAYTEAGIQ